MEVRRGDLVTIALSGDYGKVGWVSRWLPVITGGRLVSRPGRRAKMLPILSTRTVQPAASHQPMKSRRAAPSRSLAETRRGAPRTGGNDGKLIAGGIDTG